MRLTGWNLQPNYQATHPVEGCWDRQFNPELGRYIGQMMARGEAKEVQLTNLCIALKQYPLQYKQIASAAESVLAELGTLAPHIDGSSAATLRLSLCRIIQQRAVHLFHSIEVAYFFRNTLIGPYIKDQLLDMALSTLQLLQSINCTDESVIGTCHTVISKLPLDIPSLEKKVDKLPTIQGMIGTLRSALSGLPKIATPTAELSTPLPNESWQEEYLLVAPPTGGLKSTAPNLFKLLYSTPIYPPLLLLEWIINILTEGKPNTSPSKLPATARTAFVNYVGKSILGSTYVPTIHYPKIIQLFDQPPSNPLLWTAILRAYFLTIEKFFADSRDTGSTTLFMEIYLSSCALVELQDLLEGPIGETALIDCGFERIVCTLWDTFWNDVTLSNTTLVPLLRVNIQRNLQITPTSPLPYKYKLQILTSLHDLRNLSKLIVLEDKTDEEIQAPIELPYSSNLHITNLGRYFLVALSSLSSSCSTSLWDHLFSRATSDGDKTPCTLSGDKDTKASFKKSSISSLPPELYEGEVRDSIATLAKEAEDAIYKRLKKLLSHSREPNIKV